MVDAMRHLHKRPLSCAQSATDLDVFGIRQTKRSMSFGPVNSDFLMVLETEAATERMIENRLELLAKEFPMPQTQEVCYGYGAVLQGVTRVLQGFSNGSEVSEKTTKLVLLVLFYGFVSAYSYISLNTEYPGSADLILFSQYVFCVVEGLYSGSVSKYCKSDTLVDMDIL